MQTEAKPVRALFVGFGNVGQKLAEILFLEREKHPNIQSLGLSVIGIVTKSHGSLVNNNGVDMVNAMHEIREGGRFSWSNFSLTNMNGLDAVRQLDYDVLIELSTLSIAQKGEPALSHVREALNRGKHVVTANKAPAAFRVSRTHLAGTPEGCEFFNGINSHGRDAGLQYGEARIKGSLDSRRLRSAQLDNQFCALADGARRIAPRGGEHCTEGRICRGRPAE